jgi:hypothetical protein
MTDKAPGVVGVTFAKGVLEDVAELTTPAADSDQAAKTKPRLSSVALPSCWSNAKATRSSAS